MTQALCMFDGNARLIICNDRYPCGGLTYVLSRAVPITAAYVYGKTVGPHALVVELDPVQVGAVPTERLELSAA